MTSAIAWRFVFFCASPTGTDQPNALKAMPQRGTLTVVSRALEMQYVEIQFRDTGRGIPQKYLPRIFDPFFTREPAGKGMGLGLSISYGVIPA